MNKAVRINPYYKTHIHIHTHTHTKKKKEKRRKEKKKKKVKLHKESVSDALHYMHMPSAFLITGYDFSLFRAKTVRKTTYILIM